MAIALARVNPSVPGIEMSATITSGCANPMPESFHAVSSGVPIRPPTEVRLVDPVGMSTGSACHIETVAVRARRVPPEAPSRRLQAASTRHRDGCGGNRYSVRPSWRSGPCGARSSEEQLGQRCRSIAIGPFHSSPVVPTSTAGEPGTTRIRACVHGSEACRRIRQVKPGAKIIVVSARAALSLCARLGAIPIEVLTALSASAFRQLIDIKSISCR